MTGRFVLALAVLLLATAASADGYERRNLSLTQRRRCRAHGISAPACGPQAGPCDCGAARLQRTVQHQRRNGPPPRRLGRALRGGRIRGAVPRQLPFAGPGQRLRYARASDRSARPRRGCRSGGRLARSAAVRGQATALRVLGWSNGGSSVLWAVGGATSPTHGEWRTAIAFYPGCRVPSESQTWTPRFKPYVLIGSADDWTPPEPCRRLAERNQYC